MSASGGATRHLTNLNQIEVSRHVLGVGRPAAIASESGLYKLIMRSQEMQRGRRGRHLPPPRRGATTRRISFSRDQILWKQPSIPNWPRRPRDLHIETPI
ncbi:hypothetical protein [Paramagnetospirillum magnetotacticum]|uniref:hypothetical protein n=1 Tax=Paramagnetospirillum magnetotacticum TaxID=188 RepID=UPI0038996B58